MNSSDDWQDLYKAALLETDPTILQKRIAAAQEAIRMQLQKLAEDHWGTRQERQNISHALKSLKVLPPQG